MLKRFLLLSAALTILASACGPATPPPVTGGPPSFEIVSPTEGASVSGPDVTIEIQAQNLTVQAPGGANNPNQGHFHVWVDAANYKVVSETSFVLTLPPGEHRVRIELRNSDHTAFDLDPPAVRIVNFTVSGTAGSMLASGEEATPSGYNYSY